MTRFFLFIIISTFSSTYAKAQKIDIHSIAGKWISIDTVSKTIMTFYFDDKSNATCYYGKDSISFKYLLSTEDAKQVLTFIHQDANTNKYVVRLKPNNELELFVSKIADFNTNTKAWGINEFITLVKQLN